MSEYGRDDGSNDFQSVHDPSAISPHGQDEHNGYQVVAASFVAAPWSPYNTRSVSYHSLPCSSPGEQTSLHAPGQVDPAARHLDGFRDSFPSIDALGRYTNTAGMANFRQSSPRNSSLPGHLSTSAATAVVGSDTSPCEMNADHEILSCTQCNQTFTGAYRSGNCARHVRLKHTRADLYECDAPDCFKTYQRPDARLKHMRSRHPELQVPPMQRRRPEASTTQSLGHIRAISPSNQFLHLTDHEHTTVSASDYLGVPSAYTGTRPSTPSYERSFSQHPGSAFTDPYDSNFLNPHLPYHRRPTSLSTDGFEDRLLSPLPSPGPAASQYDHDACIDPALLNSTGIESRYDAAHGEGYFS